MFKRALQNQRDAAHGWTPSFLSTLDRVRPLEIKQQSTAEDGAARRAVVVDTAAAGGQRCVDLAKHARTLHHLPSSMRRVRDHDQRLQVLRKGGVQGAEFGCFLIGDGDLGQVAAVGASVAPTQVRLSTVLGKTLTGQWTVTRWY